jgi:signal transduction histidine kinase/DNA-binding response OmpR family regulator
LEPRQTSLEICLEGVNMEEQARILLVSGEPQFSSELATELADWGYTPVLAHDGRTVQSQLNQASPAIALVDLCQGELSSYEALETIKAQSPGTGCIALVESLDGEVVTRAVELGASTFLSKPLRTDLLKAILRRIVAEHQARLNSLSSTTFEGFGITDGGIISDANQQLAAINAMGQMVTSSLDIDQVLRYVVDGVPQMVGAEGVLLLFLEGEEFVFAATSGEVSEQLCNMRMPSHIGVAGSVLRNEKPVLVRDEADRAQVFAEINQQGGYQTRSLMAVPVLLGGQVVGVMEAVHSEPNAFDQGDLNLLETTAAWTAIALGNARQHKALQRQLQESQALASISQALNETLELDRILDLIANSARQIIPQVERAVIHLFDEDQQVLKPIAISSEFNMGEQYLSMRAGIGVAGLVLDQGITLNIGDTEQDERFVPQEGRGSGYLRSLLVAPVQSGDHRLGTISVSSAIPYAFSRADDRLLTILGVQAALAIEGARIFEETRQRLKEVNALYTISNQIVTSIDVNVDEIIQHVVNMLWKDFGYYHVHIYLFDETRKTLTVHKGSGPIGAKMAAGRYQLTLDEGVVGYVATVGDAFVTNDISQVHFYVPNPLLPDTKAELAAPLRARGNLLGVLDIHHRAPNTFSEDDLRLVRTVADQLAAGLDKTMLYGELQETLRMEKSIRAQLIQSEKLAAMGRLVASVAHELNNPLQAIQNALYLVKMEKTLSPRAQEDLQIALDETTRMGNLIARLRDAYRPTSLDEYHLASLNILVEEVEKLITTHLRHSEIRYEFHPDPDLPLTLMNRDQIKQVILNLCLNAVETMPDGGVLRIKTDYQAKDSQVLLAVKDTGPGISADTIPHLFEPFFTTRDKGTGLGLFISYEIIQNHNGSIQVESCEGQGTTFLFSLPVMS